MSVSAIRILLVEDNPGDARLVKEALPEQAKAHFSLRMQRTLVRL